jgi:hypothetical protein
VVNLHSAWSDERTIADTYWSQPRTNNIVSWLAIRVRDDIHLGDTMTKPKTWEDPARSLEADWPPHQPITLMDLVAEARALDWDFSHWCYASGHDATDPDARSCSSACWLTPDVKAAPA